MYTYLIKSNVNASETDKRFKNQEHYIILLKLRRWQSVISVTERKTEAPIGGC